MLKASLVVVSLAIAPRLAAGCLSVDASVDNIILKSADGKIELTGKALAGFGSITVDVFPLDHAPNPIQALNVSPDNTWRVELKLPLNVASRVVLERNGCGDRGQGLLDLLITPVKSDPLTKRQPSTVQVIWLDDVIPKLRQIGEETQSTLTDPPGFVVAVKDETLRVAQEYLSHYAIKIGTATAGNKLRFTGDFVKGYYGWTHTRPGNRIDCGDAAQDDLVDVYVGTLAADIIGRPTIWKLLADSDKRSVRISDLGHILGTIAAHEVLHATGLLGCDWMQGDEEGHNNRRFEQGREKRYGSGEHLMDPFAIVDPRSLIGRRDSTGTERQSLRNDAFSSSYLAIIHPKEQ